MVGVPVFRYSKKPLTTPHERMKYLATIAREGPQSILVPDEVLVDGLSEWLIHMSDSFTKIRKGIEKHVKNKLISPAELLATMVKVQNIDIDLMGYSGANFFFFGDLIEKIAEGKELSYRNYSTQFGYWLCNYVLLFPGPILNTGAAAAYLEIEKSDIEDIVALQNLLEKAVYRGPFAELGPYYLKRNLDDILSKSGKNNFLEYFQSQRINFPSERTTDGTPRYYCVVNDIPIMANDAKGPLDWIPKGADMCRIKKETYEKFGPWLSV
jgi:hypothetical protein